MNLQHWNDEIKAFYQLLNNDLFWMVKEVPLAAKKVLAEHYLSLSLSREDMEKATETYTTTMNWFTHCAKKHGIEEAQAKGVHLLSVPKE